MFATRFWTANYGEGLETLFGKLNQGVVENAELLAAARARAEAEESHGTRLSTIATSLAPKKHGFAKDDGATMRKAYEGILQQLMDESSQHRHIAESIKSMVVEPFSKWSTAHQQRIAVSQAELQRLAKVYESEMAGMSRARHRYFNKCRLDEDMPPAENTGDSNTAAESEVTSEELLLGGHHYSADESQRLFKAMLDDIPQSSIYVTILGTYDHTVTGAQLTSWLMENTAAKTLSSAEEAGQMLVKQGFLRLVGQMGSKFVNSSVFTYQWRPRAWEFAGLTTSSSSLGLAERWARSTAAATDSGAQSSVKELDQKYRKSVDSVEHARLELEATMVEHLNYLERCERERLAAFKAVLLDFSAAISNVVPALSAGVDKLLLFHETANVDRDLRFLVENYQTGRYAPRVAVYDNYYSSTDGAAVFGLDLELRARADKKRVPLVVGQILGYLDANYPKMENDDERLMLWKRPLNSDIRLAQKARQQLNHSSGQVSAPLAPLALVQALKLYFLELPISVVGGQLYDILKGIYQRYAESDESRLQALQNTLGQLTVTHIATLDALTSHIYRLVTIAKASPEDMDQIASEWGPALCRPKTASVLAIDDTFPALLLKDLVTDRERLFGELKRQQSRSASLRSVSERRPRQASAQEPRQESRRSSRQDTSGFHSAPDLNRLVLSNDRQSGESAGRASEPAREPQAPVDLGPVHASDHAPAAPAPANAAPDNAVPAYDRPFYAASDHVFAPVPAAAQTSADQPSADQPSVGQPSVDQATTSYGSDHTSDQAPAEGRAVLGSLQYMPT